MRKLSTLEGYNTTKTPVDAYFRQNVIFALSFKIGTAIQKLLPKENLKVVSKRYGGRIFRQFHCSGRNPKK